MKVYKVTVMVIDHDRLGTKGIVEEMEAVRYPNHCMYPRVAGIESRDIGEWDDSHPLNKFETMQDEFDRLFGARS